MSVGNGLPGGRGMHAAPVCKVKPTSRANVPLPTESRVPVRRWRQDEPSRRSFRESVRTKPVDAMAERAFHAIRAFRFRQGVQPIGLTSIRTPARELIQRPFFLWQGNGRRYEPKASLMQRQRSTPVGAHLSVFSPEGFRFSSASPQR
jgi:hypothetical protein